MPPSYRPKNLAPTSIVGFTPVVTTEVVTFLNGVILKEIIRIFLSMIHDPALTKLILRATASRLAPAVKMRSNCKLKNLAQMSTAGFIPAGIIGRVTFLSGVITTARVLRNRVVAKTQILDLELNPSRVTKSQLLKRRQVMCLTAAAISQRLNSLWEKTGRIRAVNSTPARLSLVNFLSGRISLKLVRPNLRLRPENSRLALIAAMSGILNEIAKIDAIF